MRALWAWVRANRTSVILAVALAVLALSSWSLLLPTRLTVAVTGPDTQEAKVLAAYAQALEQDKKSLRLRLVGFASYRETAEALERGAADVAVVRPDIVHPGNGLTTVIMREEALIIVAPKAREIDGVDGLRGKRLGVLARDDTDLHVLDVVLAHFGVPDAEVGIERLGAADLDGGGAAALDAVAFVATPHSEDARRVMQSVVKTFGSDLSVVGFEGLTSLSMLRPGFQETTLAAGALSSQPKLPAEDAKTASISYRLVVSDRLDRISVATLTQYLVEMRPRVARQYTFANLMKQPPGEQEMSAPLPNHRGAVDYFNREQQTFMDRWGDWLWLGLFAVGGVTSIFAWLRQQFVRRRQKVIDRVLDRLLCMIPEARKADSAQLDALSAELDDLVTYAVRHARWRGTSAPTMSALVMALDGVRSAIADRRRDLARHNPDLVPEQSALEHVVESQMLAGE
jgi:TRAP-type uncharacterized transport system substrate-binding protein